MRHEEYLPSQLEEGGVGKVSGGAESVWKVDGSDWEGLDWESASMEGTGMWTWLVEERSGGGLGIGDKWFGASKSGDNWKPEPETLP